MARAPGGRGALRGSRGIRVEWRTGGCSKRSGWRNDIDRDGGAARPAARAHCVWCAAAGRAGGVRPGVCCSAGTTLGAVAARASDGRRVRVRAGQNARSARSVNQVVIRVQGPEGGGRAVQARRARPAPVMATQGASKPTRRAGWRGGRGAPAGAAGPARSADWRRPGARGLYEVFWGWDGELRSTKGTRLGNALGAASAQGKLRRQGKESAPHEAATQTHAECQGGAAAAAGAAHEGRPRAKRRACARRLQHNRAVRARPPPL